MLLEAKTDETELNRGSLRWQNSRDFSWNSRENIMQLDQTVTPSVPHQAFKTIINDEDLENLKFPWLTPIDISMSIRI